MIKSLVLSLAIVCSLQASAQDTKEALVKELSGILEKVAGTTWKQDGVTHTLVRQSADLKGVNQVIKENGYYFDEKIDETTTYKYSFSWDSLSKVSTTPPKGRFVLAGCDENAGYCYYQLNFPSKALYADKNGKEDKYRSWFYVYIRKEDKDRYFQLLQKLYQLMHPGK